MLTLCPENSRYALQYLHLSEDKIDTKHVTRAALVHRNAASASRRYMRYMHAGTATSWSASAASGRSARPLSQTVKQKASAKQYKYRVVLLIIVVCRYTGGLVASCVELWVR